MSAVDLAELHRGQRYALNQLNQWKSSTYWLQQVRWMGTEIRIHPLARKRDYAAARRRNRRAKAIYVEEKKG